MKFASLATAALAFALPAFARVEPLTYDTTYDNPSLSLSNVACSNGANGLLNRGYTTLGSLPTFPNLGGAYTVSWNSTECGSCYEITYGNKKIIALAVDYCREGFNLSKEAMYNLTGKLGVDVGKVNVTSTQVDPCLCGL